MLIFGISGERGQTDYLAKLAAHPLGGFCTDAEDYGHGRPHPAAYGAFASVFDLFVSRGIISFEEAVRKMTSFPAKVFGLTDRGSIRPGARADLVLLRQSGLKSSASFDQPRRLAKGIDKVWINGQLVMDSGKIVDSSAGRVIRHGSASR
jgi:N-acyl-D-amino-acid deacylase